MGRRKGSKNRRTRNQIKGDDTMGYRMLSGKTEDKQVVSTYRKGWNTEESVKVARNCDWAADRQAYEIMLSKEVEAVITYLCKHIKDEWQMLLLGEVVEDQVQCTGYYIPKQKVTRGTVTNLDCIDREFIQQNKVVATIHSHADMGVFFSQTDEVYTNMSLIDHHIVCNNSGEFKGCSKFSLPCGKVFLAKSDVVIMSEPLESVEGYDNIKKEYARGYFTTGLSDTRSPHYSPCYGYDYGKKGYGGGLYSGDEWDAWERGWGSHKNKKNGSRQDTINVKGVDSAGMVDAEFSD